MPIAMVSAKAKARRVTFTKELSVMYIYTWTDEIGDSITTKQTKPLPRFKKPQIVYAFDPKIKVPRDLEGHSIYRRPRAPEWQPKPAPEHTDEFK